MTAFEFVTSFKYLPWSTERFGEATRSEVRRWFRKKSVLINGDRLSEKDEIQFPVHQLVFFPNGRRKTTYM